MNAKDSYYISTGRTNAMFTLRVDTINSWTRRPIDQFVKNLSTDFETAWNKAYALVGDDLRTRKEDELSVRDIVRGEKDEAKRTWQATKEQEKLACEERMLDAIADGRIPFGKYADQEIARLPKTYLRWLIEMGQKKDASRVDVALAAEASKYAELFDTKSSEHVGQVGERVVINGVVTASFTVNGFYGSSQMVVVLDENGNVFTMATNAAAVAELKVDEKVSIQGNIKAHRVYKGVKQTVLNRPKLVK